MTLPSEEYNAICAATRFLYDLMDPKKTPRVPKHIRAEARRKAHAPSRDADGAIPGSDHDRTRFRRAATHAVTRRINRNDSLPMRASQDTYLDWLVFIW
jgi:hypothetical protein